MTANVTRNVTRHVTPPYLYPHLHHHQDQKKRTSTMVLKIRTGSSEADPQGARTPLRPPLVGHV